MRSGLSYIDSRLLDTKEKREFALELMGTLNQWHSKNEYLLFHIEAMEQVLDNLLAQLTEHEKPGRCDDLLAEYNGVFGRTFSDYEICGEVPIGWAGTPEEYEREM